MSDKMVHWDALKATDPKFTKPVTFGRKFTSINSQWQLQRMTEQFGPIGQGWGYDVAHSIERIRDDYVLAIADVTIWWKPDYDMARCEYGPVRGMCPLVEKTKNGLHDDDDAGKKAMTDALTKGLSHLGLSADVFLGLFDDNKYIRQVTEQFANGNGHPQAAAPSIPEEDKGLLTKEHGEKSQYQVDKTKAAIAADWKVTNKTPTGMKDQIFDYIDRARNPDDIHAILSNNAQIIANSGSAMEIEEAADKLLRWFEKQAAPALQ